MRVHTQRQSRWLSCSKRGEYRWRVQAQRGTIATSAPALDACAKYAHTAAAQAIAQNALGVASEESTRFLLADLHHVVVPEGTREDDGARWHGNAAHDHRVTARALRGARAACHQLAAARHIAAVATVLPIAAQRQGAATGRNSNRGPRGRRGGCCARVRRHLRRESGARR